MLVTKRSSPTSWTLSPMQLGEVLPAVPVVFGEAVFDGDDGVFVDPALPEGGHLFGGEFALVGFLEDVLAGFFVVELAGGGVEGDEDVFAGRVAGELDGLDDEIESFVVGLERWERSRLRRRRRCCSPSS